MKHDTLATGVPRRDFIGTRNARTTSLRTQ